MKNRVIAASGIVILAASMLTLSANVAAEWQAEPDAFSDKFWRVSNTESGQTLTQVYKSEKKAKKAAKILNRGDKSVMVGPDGEGDFKHGGELPR